LRRLFRTDLDSLCATIRAVAGCFGVYFFPIVEFRETLRASYIFSSEIRRSLVDRCARFGVSLSPSKSACLWGALWVGPPGSVVYSAWASNPPRSGKPGDLLKSCPCAAILLGWLPSDEIPGVSSLGCVLVAGRVCLWVLLCCVHPIPFLPPHLPYPTVVPIVSSTSSTLHCFIGRLISLMWLE
jgi:hypothetical protein